MNIAASATVILAFASLVNAAEYRGEARKFIVDDVFTCPSTDLTFHVPDLKTDLLQVRYREVTPGITWHLSFTEELGHMASVTYTKIRAEYPKTDESLLNVAAHLKGNIMREGGYLEWAGFLSQNEGRALQCVIRYPNAGQTVSVRNKWLDARQSVQNDVYALRHYIVRDGWYLEFNVYFPQFLPKGSYDEDKLVDRWSLSLQSFVSGSGLVGNKDSYPDQVKKFTRPKTYFRFVYADPSSG